MIADEPRSTPAIGAPDVTLLNADAFHHEIVAFIARELPVWRDLPNRQKFTDEPNLNQRLCLHFDTASRHQCFDAIRFLQETLQPGSRRIDIGVMKLGTIMVEGINYEDYLQLLPIECKRLPTQKDKRRSDCEYVHGLAGHRVGAIERFKHGLHGPGNPRAMIIAYIQSGEFNDWLHTINERLGRLADDGTDEGLWSPVEPLAVVANHADPHKLLSHHRRLKPPASSDSVEIEHLWLRMN